MNSFDDWDDFETEGNESEPSPQEFGGSSFQNRRLDMPSESSNFGSSSIQDHHLVLPDDDPDTFAGIHRPDASPRNNEPAESAEPKSFVKVGATLGVLLFIVVILILFGRSWLMNNTNKPVENDAIPPVVEKEKTKKDEGAYDNLEGSTATVVTGSLVKVAQTPEFGEVYSRTGIVKDKGIVEVAGKDTYVCGLEILITANKSSTIPVTYYCNKDTYDAVKEGTKLTVYYQIDDYGKIVVVKVTD